jgi:DNA-binding HxlR family transcriptional regulator
MKAKVSECPLEGAFILLSGRWRSLILYCLMDGPKRFNALQRANPGLSQQMLSRDLKDFEAAGVVSRSVTPTVPPQVEYALTDAGNRLIPILKELGDWWEDTRTLADTTRAAQVSLETIPES